MSERYPYRKKVTIDGHTVDIKARTLEELAHKLAKKEQEIQRGVVLSGSSTLVNTWFLKYFRVYVEEVRDLNPDTLRDRKGLYYNHIAPHIGTMRIKDVTTEHCQAVLSDMHGYSRDRINKCAQLLHDLFKKAVRDRLIYVNPAEDLNRPPAEDGQGRPLTAVERVVLLDVGRHHRAGLWVELMIYCGLRPGETDLFRGGHINYDHGLIYTPGIKTNAGERIIPAPDHLLRQLYDLHLDPDEFVFKNQYGDRMRKSSRDRLWHSLLRDVNIEMGCRVYRNQVLDPVTADDLVPYCCRHTFATDLRDAEVPFSIRQMLLGHSRKSVTDNYTHDTDYALNLAADRLKAFRTGQEKELADLLKAVKKDGYKAKNVPEENLFKRYFPETFI